MQMPQVSRGRALAYAAAILVILAVGGRFVLGPDAGTRPGAALAAQLEVEPAPARKLVVHVVGEVRRPGLYELEEGSRVAAAVELAGGPKPKAALELLNLAAPVGDGQQIVVPARQEGAEQALPSGGARAAGGPVRLNSASLAELDTLPGVGPVTAQKILDYREKHGGFRALDELDAIPGIGPARLEQLKEVVQL